MPQLDKFTFLDQTLSVIFILLVLYFINVYVFLPKLIFILKLRTRILRFIKYKQSRLDVEFIAFKQVDALYLKFWLLSVLSSVKCFALSSGYYRTILKYVSTTMLSNRSMVK